MKTETLWEHIRQHENDNSKTKISCKYDFATCKADFEMTAKQELLEP